MLNIEPASPKDIADASRQLGRPLRAIIGVAWRCPSGEPGVITTRPRLANGGPFPTTYYLACPRAIYACSKLEASGVMSELNRKLAEDPKLRAQYQAAHESYLADRDEIEVVAEIAGYSAGGMPERVKCLHALLAHALAKGPGVNPIGDWVIEQLGDFCQGPHSIHVDDFELVEGGEN